MFSMEKPAGARLLAHLVDGREVDLAAAAIVSSSGKTSSATKRLTRSFSSAMSGGSSGMTMVGDLDVSEGSG
jgi:hypothetical protein